MISFFRRFVFSILLAQWIYAEAVLLLPASQPALDTISQFLKPPTHDKWVEMYRNFQGQKETVVAQARDISDGGLATELMDTVEKIRAHNAFGSIR